MFCLLIHCYKSSAPTPQFAALGDRSVAWTGTQNVDQTLCPALLSQCREKREKTEGEQHPRASPRPHLGSKNATSSSRPAGGPDTQGPGGGTASCGSRGCPVGERGSLPRFRQPGQGAAEKVVSAEGREYRDQHPVGEEAPGSHRPQGGGPNGSAPLTPSGPEKANTRRPGRRVGSEGETSTTSLRSPLPALQPSSGDELATAATTVKPEGTVPKSDGTRKDQRKSHNERAGLKMPISGLNNR